MAFGIYKYIVKKWIVLRMAADEFYFKQPFEIKDEYPIMKSILFLALMPIEMLIVFTYARIYGSLHNYIWQILSVIAAVNLLISNVAVNNIKDKPLINETMVNYEQLGFDDRKKIYSFKNGAIVLFWVVLVPWMILFAGIWIVCLIVPH